MGHYKDDKGVQCYSPDNDDNTLYIMTTFNSIPFGELIDQIRDHFGEDVDINDLEISSERIHTRAIYYDLHDPMDWDDYLVITK